MATHSMVTLFTLHNVIINSLTVMPVIHGCYGNILHGNLCLHKFIIIIIVVMGDTYFFQFGSIPSTRIQTIEGIEYDTEYVSTAHAQYHVDLIE